MDLITLEEYKDFHGLSANPKEDTKISMLISMVSALIQTYIGIKNTEGGSAGQEVTEVISLDYDTNIIYLDNYPIEGPVTVTEADRYTVDSTVHVPLVYASDYLVNLAEGTLTRARTSGGFARWPVGPSVVIVTYTTTSAWGETGSIDEVPADLKLACIELVSYYKNSEWQAKNIQGSSTSITIAKSGTDFPQHIQVLLDKYKK